jgi:serine/threonine protein kinase
MLDNLCKNCFHKIDSATVCPKCGYSGNSPIDKETLNLGSILNGKYIIGRVLGRGGFGVTYLGYDLNLNIKVAIKEYLPQVLVTRRKNSPLITIHSGNKESTFKEGLEKFISEARIVAMFAQNPNIVSIREFFPENKTAYMVMDYIEGVDLAGYVRKKGRPLSFIEALKLLNPLMSALQQVHNVGLLHRDISPDNIYITEEGTPILLDFGAARQYSSQTKSMSVILKLGYAPIEQHQRKGKSGPWTDVYAFAATFYHVITGKRPPEALDRLEEEILIPPSAKGVDIPKSAEAALIKALAVRSKDRFQMMDVFSNAISACLQDMIKEQQRREEKEKVRQQQYEKKYKQALDALKSKRFSFAIKVFSELGDFRDSKKQLEFAIAQQRDVHQQIIDEKTEKQKRLKEQRQQAVFQRKENKASRIEASKARRRKKAITENPIAQTSQKDDVESDKAVIDKALQSDKKVTIPKDIQTRSKKPNRWIWISVAAVVLIGLLATIGYPLVKGNDINETLKIKEVLNVINQEKINIVSDDDGFSKRIEEAVKYNDAASWVDTSKEALDLIGENNIAIEGYELDYAYKLSPFANLRIQYSQYTDDKYQAIIDTAMQNGYEILDQYSRPDYLFDNEEGYHFATRIKHPDHNQMYMIENMNNDFIEISFDGAISPGDFADANFKPDGFVGSNGFEYYAEALEQYFGGDIPPFIGENFTRGYGWMNAGEAVNIVYKNITPDDYMLFKQKAIALGYTVAREHEYNDFSENHDYEMIRYGNVTQFDQNSTSEALTLFLLNYKGEYAIQANYKINSDNSVIIDDSNSIFAPLQEEMARLSIEPPHHEIFLDEVLNIDFKYFDKDETFYEKIKAIAIENGYRVSWDHSDSYATRCSVVKGNEEVEIEYRKENGTKVIISLICDPQQSGARDVVKDAKNEWEIDLAFDSQEKMMGMIASDFLDFVDEPYQKISWMYRPDMLLYFYDNKAGWLDEITEKVTNAGYSVEDNQSPTNIFTNEALDFNITIYYNAQAGEFQLDIVKGKGHCGGDVVFQE